MAFLKRNLPAGIALGVVAGYAAREAFPALSNVVRPATKTVMKSAILGFEKLKEAFAHAGETLEDLTSEVRAELANEGAISNSGHAGSEETDAAPEVVAPKMRKARKDNHSDASPKRAAI